METDNIPINKMISILVAIVVTACVLVPICNVFGSNGGEPVQISDEDVIGYPMKLFSGNSLTIDLTEYPDDVPVIVTGMWIWFGGSEPHSLQYSGSYNDIYDNTYIVGKTSDGLYGVKYLDSSDWFTTTESIWIYDESSPYRVLLANEDSEAGIPVGYEDTAMFGFYNEYYQGPGGGSIDAIILFDAEGNMINGSTARREIVDASLDWGDYTFDTVSALVSFEPSAYGEDEPIVWGDSGYYKATWYMAYKAGSDNGGNSGTVGTLISVIPVFVFLAILGMVAKMLFDRKIANQ